MRRRNREINLFSMSALDLFASAMGAFLLIAVAALPYYLKTDKSLTAEVNKLEEQLKQCQAVKEEIREELRKCSAEKDQITEQRNELQGKLEKCQGKLKTCNQKLSQTFLSVMILWEEKADVDLHVTDPAGNEFYYKKHNRAGNHFPRTTAKLTWDVTQGPGVELWESNEPQAGIYTVKYNLFQTNRSPGPFKILGKVYYRNGAVEIRPVTLTNSELKRKTLAYKIKLGQDGSIEVLWEP